MFSQYWEAMLGTIWAALLALVVLTSSLFVQFGIEWIATVLGVSHSASAEYLVQAVDMTGAAGSGVTFILLTALQVIRLFREVRKEVSGSEQH